MQRLRYLPCSRSVEHAVTVRNDVNLKKSSIRLLERDPHAAVVPGMVPTVGPMRGVKPGQLFLEFKFDASTPCAISIYFMVIERPSAAKGASSRNAYVSACAHINRIYLEMPWHSVLPLDNSCPHQAPASSLACVPFVLSSPFFAPSSRKAWGRRSRRRCLRLRRDRRRAALAPSECWTRASTQRQSLPTHQRRRRASRRTRTRGNV